MHRLWAGALRSFRTNRASSYPPPHPPRNGDATSSAIAEHVLSSNHLWTGHKSPVIGSHFIIHAIHSPPIMASSPVNFNFSTVCFPLLSLYTVCVWITVTFWLVNTLMVRTYTWLISSIKCTYIARFPTPSYVHVNLTSAASSQCCLMSKVLADAFTIKSTWLSINPWYQIFWLILHYLT